MQLCLSVLFISTREKEARWMKEPQLRGIMGMAALRGILVLAQSNMKGVGKRPGKDGWNRCTRRDMI